MSRINYDKQMSMKCKECILEHKKELKTMAACQFAEKYNLNYHAVLYWLKELNIKYAKYGNSNGKRISEETMDIIELLKKGTMTYQQIADIKGITRQRVGAIAKSFGLTNKSKKETYLERLQSDDNLCNMSVAEISKKHDIPYNTALKLLSANNMAYAKWNRPVLSEEDHKQLLEDLKSRKYSYRILAEKYKVSLNWVVSVAKKNNLTPGELAKED